MEKEGLYQTSADKRGAYSKRTENDFDFFLSIPEILQLFMWIVEIKTTAKRKSRN